jgi:hypothetical protein
MTPRTTDEIAEKMAREILDDHEFVAHMKALLKEALTKSLRRLITEKTD